MMWLVKLLIMIAAASMLGVPLIVVAQTSEPIGGLLLRFDNEHDLAAKERLLLTLTGQDPLAGPVLLRLAESTANSDTRWMAMRGMATLRYTACAQFLESSLKDSDVFVRANAARALGDLRIGTAAAALMVMFAAEKEPAAVEQASLALRMLDIKSAAPFIRQKLPVFTGQTRSWLVQALGELGSVDDVPAIAGYLDDMATEWAATFALAQLSGVNFGPHRMNGLSAYPEPATLAARAWWQSHKGAWPRCDDCSRK